MRPGAGAGAAADRLRAQGEGAAAAPPRARRCCSPIATCCRLLRKEVVLADNASWLFRVAPYLIFAAPGSRRRWCRPSPPACCSAWSADLIAIIALLGSARFFLALAGMDVGTSFGGIGSEPRGDDRLAGRAGDADDRLHAGADRRLDPAVARSRRSWSRPSVGLRVSLGLGAGRADHRGDRRERAAFRSTIRRRISS